VTELLIAQRSGHADDVLDELLLLIYDDLRTIARQQLARLRPGNTLDTTALVHEAYLKLVDQSRVEPNDLDHFFALAAGAMRQILVDHVRQRTALKRGGGSAPLSLDRLEIGVDEQADVLLALDQLLEGLSRNNPRLTRVFECRFFAGMSEQETARALGLPLRTVQRDWFKSRAWLRKELRGGAT
jgi:RNA polymerase sigma factor (TIGR02999 family)